MPDMSLAEGAMPAYVFGWTAQREYAKRWGIRKSEMLSYGEPWVG